MQVAVSALLVAGLLSAIDFDQARLLESARGLHWWPVLAALLLRPVAVWARSWQAAVLFSGAGIALSVRELWRAFMFGEMLSRFVPGNLGTMAYVARLSDRLGDAIIAQLLDRILFLALTLLVAVSALLGAGRQLPALLALIALFGVVLFVVVLYRGLLGWASVRWPNLRLPPSSPTHRETIMRLLRSREQWGGAYVVASVLSLALTSVLFALLVAACGGRLRVFDMLAAVALVTIGAALPITVNGVGVREWVFVSLLNETLPSPEAVVTLAATTYLVGLSSALLGVVVWGALGLKGGSGEPQG